MNPTLIINELFGPTVQGEGPLSGAPAFFLRTHSCPVQCEGCDSNFTWDGSETGTKIKRNKLVSTVAAQFKEHPTAGLVITGGEPLIHYANPAMLAVADKRNTNAIWTNLETSGYFTKRPPLTGTKFDQLCAFVDKFDCIAISPKVTPCFMGKISVEDTYENVCSVVEAIGVSSPCLLAMKFVVKDEACLTAATAFRKKLCTRYPELLAGGVSWHLMPFGTTTEQMLPSIENIIPCAAKEGWVLSSRLQCLIWGRERNR